MRKIKHTHSRQRPLALREWAMGFLAMIILSFSGIGLANAMASVSLKPSSVIEGDMITLGHVFSGIDRNADKVLGPAPQPGKDMVLNARTLMRIARAMDVNWRPSSAADQVVLRRAATVIPATMIQDALKDSLHAQGLPGKFELIVTSSGLDKIILPQSAAQNVEIESLSFDSEHDRFEAAIAAPSKDEPLFRKNISGQVQRLVDVPVLRAPMKNGTVISASDLDFISLRAYGLNHDMILSADELVGMTPRRMITAGKPMTENDIEPPQIVERGENVTLVFNSGPLSLTAQGKALENGAKGDVIRVVNASSSKTLQARVIGEREVSVSSF
ncbi:MAG: flagellar basal body P-ring formation protein FlgA [Alphaproteobacteria bacterium]|nr:flagellar basal body P-ring formation protein FlgA [Alphaproteobacteria bacterium]